MLSLFLKLPEFTVMFPEANIFPYSVTALLFIFPFNGISGCNALPVSTFSKSFACRFNVSVSSVSRNEGILPAKVACRPVSLSINLLLKLLHLLCLFLLTVSPSVSKSIQREATSPSDILVPSQVS